jgi:hypothetical protein
MMILLRIVIKTIFQKCVHNRFVKDTETLTLASVMGDTGFNRILRRGVLDPEEPEYFRRGCDLEFCW